MLAAEETALAGGTGPTFIGHSSPCRDARLTGNAPKASSLCQQACRS